VPSFKPAYLIHGDDHGRIGERRARLREVAEAESGAGGVELLEGDAAAPDAVARTLSAMTFAVGRRFVIVDGAERYRDGDIDAELTSALKDIAPDTTVAFFGREDGRTKVSAKLAAAVRAAGGDVVVEQMLKARDLPRWAIAEATRLGFDLEGAAAQALVAAVGERQQRLLRELEKLALEHGPGTRVGVEEVEAVAAPSAERQVWGFVDALVARDRVGATRALLQLRSQGETMPRLVPLAARRLREVVTVAARLEAGETPQAIKGTLRMSPYAADSRLREARGAEVETLRRALEALAELELASRGMSELSDDTEALRAIETIAAVA
jgi:DNA polymerase-3 subunit delta